MAWTQERVQILKKMWSTGQSASQIAAELGGVTRNAVIGKVHRLGLSNRVNSSIKEAKAVDNASKTTKLGKNKSSGEVNKSRKISDKSVVKPLSGAKELGSGEMNKATNVRQNKPVIFNANQPLPPQPSTSEISEETLKSVRSLEKKSKKLSLMELTERTCKWPIGDPATTEFWFCGHPAEQGKPYCETHIEIAFQPVTTRKDKRTRQ